MALRRRRDIWDVVVMGGGIAGLTAAWHCSRRGLSVALIEAQPACGGQVATINELDDWPATQTVSGVELAASLVERISTEGVEVFYDTITHVSKEGDLWRVQSEKSSLRCKRVIAATGARLKTLGVPGEEELRGMGVSQCAHCDGGFFKGQDVAVVGGGDSALQEAVVLTEMCRTVYIVVRSAPKARRGYMDKATGKANIKFVWGSEVLEILGKNGVTGLKLRGKDGKSTELAIAGVFPFVGVEPNSELLPASIARDGTNRIITDANLRSSDPTLFAIGALRSTAGGDLVSAAGDAALAATLVGRETGIPAL